jgi:hydroxymethylbilane synthase
MAVRIGTRGSDLALWQARHIAGLLRSKLQLDTEVVVVKTRGDRIQNVSFHKMEGKGFFTKELQDALLHGRVDLVVHSLKDLPVDHPEGLMLAAIPERTDPADVLLARGGLLAPLASAPLGLPPGSVLGTSSLRRAAQALALEPKLTIEPLRGNVPTRVGKLRKGAYDAIMLAAAGIDRLGLDLDGLDRLDLTPEVVLPAPGQGALAIECRADDDLSDRLDSLNDQGSARCVNAERSLLKKLGGGCHLPLGCLATQHDGAVRLQAALGEIDESITQARLSRVAAVAPDPDLASQACFEALRMAAPNAVVP